MLPPLPAPPAKSVVLEGFAPNLNKLLHVGHLKNLAVANALSRILQPCQAVALLGASLGVLPCALQELHDLFDFVGYHPTIYLDTDLPSGLVAAQPGAGAYTGCQVWQGPLGPVVVVKSDGKPTYAYHDLAYAHLVKPDWYVTGCEQQGHFAALGLANRHLAMGLVLGPDGTKVKSSAGEALLASEAIDLVLDQLDPTPQPKKLAWDVLAYGFLQTGLASSSKFDPVQMTRPTAPGMYLSYTLARVHSALVKGGIALDGDSPPAHLADSDVALLGLAAYVNYYLHQSREEKDPAPLANYLLTLAKGLARVYAQQSIMCGSAGFQFAVATAYQALQKGMVTLGLFPLHEV
jgi:arginyl-tRNA synthetase